MPVSYPIVYRAKDGSGVAEQYDDYYILTASSSGLITGTHKFAGTFRPDNESELQSFSKPKLKLIDKGTHYATEPA